MSSQNILPDQIAREPYLALPADLLNYLDAAGRVTIWPAKKTFRLRLFEYLASFFEVERMYSEKEVNSLLTQHLVTSDYATIRRDLCDFRYLQRERDGSRYWREES